MRKLTAAAIVAGTAGALAWPPSRRLIASILIDTGIHLDNAGRDPGPTEAQLDRIRRGVAREIERETAARAARNGHAGRGDSAPPI